MYIYVYIYTHHNISRSSAASEDILRIQQAPSFGERLGKPILHVPFSRLCRTALAEWQAVHPEECR